MSLDPKKVAVAQRIADRWDDFLMAAFVPVNKRHRELEARVAALERGEAKAFSLVDVYRGAWQPNNRYAKGQLTTFNGSLWLAMGDTGERPGNVTDWRLIVARGRDGKDAAA